MSECLKQTRCALIDPHLSPQPAAMERCSQWWSKTSRAGSKSLDCSLYCMSPHFPFCWVKDFIWLKQSCIHQQGKDVWVMLLSSASVQNLFRSHHMMTSLTVFPDRKCLSGASCSCWWNVCSIVPQYQTLKTTFCEFSCNSSKMVCSNYLCTYFYM